MISNLSLQVDDDISMNETSVCNISQYKSYLDNYPALKEVERAIIRFVEP